MAKKRRKTIKIPQVLVETDAVQFLEYEITSEPIEEKNFKRLPQKVKDEFNQLYFLAQEQPDEAIPKILDCIEKYPDIPMFYNFLSAAYAKSGQKEKADKAIRENYRLFPDYLFARINYAELFRIRGEYDKIAEIFDHKFDLKLLYPKRSRFHITEVASFMGLMGVYFFETGKPDLAEQYYNILEKIAPDFQMTALLRYYLFPGILKKVMNKINSFRLACFCTR